jgi:hypothetical protein
MKGDGEASASLSVAAAYELARAADEAAQVDDSWWPVAPVAAAAAPAGLSLRRRMASVTPSFEWCVRCPALVCGCLRGWLAAAGRRCGWR